MSNFHEDVTMKKLLICCLFGTTATVLAKRMQAIADARGDDVQISAVGVENVASVAPAFDGFLVAPHVQYRMAALKQAIRADQCIDIIDSQAYVAIDAEKILAVALERMSQRID